MDTYDFLADPRALPLDERRATRQRLADRQRYWLTRLAVLCEPPTPDDDFPAFLLSTSTFRSLAERLNAARDRAELSTETADELDWFVASFADYLRTCDGEDSFASDTAPASKAR